MQIIVADNYDNMSKKAANIIASQITLKPNSVLGLATGATPTGTYQELVRIYREGRISFNDVVTFNLDEYYGLDRANEQSYWHYMNQHLFRQVDIKMGNVYIPNGKASDVEAECKSYEEKISTRGGIDLQLLGIGRNGHIGFNEPDIQFEALTHLVKLDNETIEANSRFFSSIDEVPREAISMGIKTIMRSKKILLLASGSEKAKTVYRMLNHKITPELPASILQLHQEVIVILDKAAAALLMEASYIKP